MISGIPQGRILGPLFSLGRIAALRTYYVDAASCDRSSSVVGCINRDAVWVEDSGGPEEPCVVCISLYCELSSLLDNSETVVTFRKTKVAQENIHSRRSCRRLFTLCAELTF